MDQQVGQLEVSVQNLELVDGLESLHNLTGKVPGLLLCEGASDLPELIQVAAVAVLHEEVEIVCCLLDIVESDYIRTGNHGKDSDFSLEVLMQLLVQIFLLYYLTRNLGISRQQIVPGRVLLVNLGENHLSKLSLAQGTVSQHVVSDDFQRFLCLLVRTFVHD